LNEISSSVGRPSLKSLVLAVCAKVGYSISFHDARLKKPDGANGQVFDAVRRSQINLDLDVSRANELRTSGREP
jgi:hypothetical protein